MRGSSSKCGVRTSHSMRHLHALHVVCLILFYFPLLAVYLLSYRPVFPPWPSTSSSTMWWTNSLCTSANEDLGTLAAYDPLTEDALAKLYLEQKGFGDLITADHKVLYEEGESRNNH